MEGLETKKIPINTDEAVKALIDGDKISAISYLKANQWDVVEFCLNVVESYKTGDDTGIKRLAFIIEELIENKKN